MVDLWSASPATLDDPGDWAKWSFDVPDSSAADDLNSGTAGTRRFFSVRGAFTAASRTARMALIVNDKVAWATSGGGMQTAGSTAGWVSDNRYQLLIFQSAQSFGAVQFPLGNFPGSNDTVPFVVGTNTVRLMTWGPDTPASSSEQVDIDLVQILYASGASGLSFGNDSTAQTAPSDYGTHTNPDPSVDDPSPAHVIRLKGPDATTGHAEAATIELRKFCLRGSEYAVDLRVHSGGTPASGVVGTTESPTTTYETLDANGRASFLVPVNTDFYYGGSDTIAPLGLDINYGTQPEVGCTGWAVGRIGV